MTSTYQVITCIDCNKTFVAHIARKRCDACNIIKFNKIMSKALCKGCGEIFMTAKTNKKYCSRLCKKAYEHRQYIMQRDEVKLW